MQATNDKHTLIIGFQTFKGDATDLIRIMKNRSEQSMLVDKNGNVVLTKEGIKT